MLGTTWITENAVIFTLDKEVGDYYVITIIKDPTPNPKQLVSPMCATHKSWLNVHAKPYDYGYTALIEELSK